MVGTSGEHSPYTRDQALLNGRVTIVFALSQYYLFVPFAALCLAAALAQPHAVLSYVATPFVLQVFSVVYGCRLKRDFDNRTPGDDPAPWARRFTILSGATGAIWGLGAVVWFAPASFSAQAYLVLAFLGMSATEFVTRAAYRPAYLAHAAGSLIPLAAMLVLYGGPYQMLTAVLVIFFGGVLYSYSGTIEHLLEESILLRHDNSELIVRLSVEKRAAEGARDAALANERAKSYFVSNISHELRTPLNAILGMAQLLERSDLEKNQRDHVKVLLEAGRGLKTLLDDIIALAQQESEPLAPPDEGGDAAQAARTVVRILQPNAWEKRLRLSVNVMPHLPYVAADSRHVRRVLLKLIGNAVKFTDRGNIEVAVDTTNDESGRKMVRIVVTDTGPGIPSHLLPTIFEPFAKGDVSYASRHAGAGVGLAVAKRLIEAVGGTIGVESEPGMGSSFWITLPALEGSSSEETSETERTVAPAGHTFLILVHDEKTHATLERLLSPFGNRLTFAESLAQAAAMSSRGDFTLIIAAAQDVNMLAATPGQRTPILALTSGEEYPPDGADLVLRWPATPEALCSAITGMSGLGDPKRMDAANEGALDAAVDAKAIAELEKSLGFKTLLDILQSYLHTSEELAASLSASVEAEDWTQAGRVAQDFAGAAGGLGLTAIANAARTLALGARDHANENVLSAAAGDVLAEHGRVREALRRLYPDLSA